MKRSIILTWVVAITITVFSVRFGLSDFGLHSPGYLEQYINRNPMRPFFRLTFGLTMGGLILAAACLLTKSMLTRRR